MGTLLNVKKSRVFVAHRTFDEFRANFEIRFFDSHFANRFPLFAVPDSFSPLNVYGYEQTICILFERTIKYSDLLSCNIHFWMRGDWRRVGMRCRRHEGRGRVNLEK